MDACWVDSPTAFGGSGNGLQTNIPNLLEDIGIPVPDGNTALLDNAAAAWHAFITCEAVEDAMNLSLLGVFRFQHVDSPEVPDIQDRLGTLASCAVNIQDTGNRLRQACSDHSSGLTQLRDTLHDLLRDLDIQLGLTLAVTIFTSFLSAGVSSAAGGAAAAAEITTTAARMASAIRDLNIVERITQAFTDIKDLLPGQDEEPDHRDPGPEEDQRCRRRQRAGRRSSGQRQQPARHTGAERPDLERLCPPATADGPCIRAKAQPGQLRVVQRG